MSQDIPTIGDKIASMGLTVPVILLLETCKPLSGLVRHADEVSGELISQPNSFIKSIAQIFSSRSQMEELIQYLEHKSA
jgi:hypothetical protein